MTIDGDYDPKRPDELSKRRTFAGKPFKDLATLQEDERITAIAKQARLSFGTVAFVTDCGPEYETKGDRYVRKLNERFPKIKVVNRFKNHPIENVETIIIQYVDS